LVEKHPGCPQELMFMDGHNRTGIGMQGVRTVQIGQNAKVPVIFLISFTALLTPKLVFFNGFQSNL
jgi:hypothetical protein